MVTPGFLAPSIPPPEYFSRHPSPFLRLCFSSNAHSCIFFFCFVIVVAFLGLQPRHMEVPRLGVE